MYSVYRPKIQKLFNTWHFCHYIFDCFQVSSHFTGTLSVILIDPLCRQGNVRYTTLPIKRFVWWSRAENSVCLSQSWCLNCPKTGVYDSVRCELNCTGDLTYISRKSQICCVQSILKSSNAIENFLRLLK